MYVQKVKGHPLVDFTRAVPKLTLIQIAPVQLSGMQMTQFWYQNEAWIMVHHGGSRIWGKRGWGAGGGGAGDRHIKIHGQFQRFFPISLI
jgi:hypothetical protein